MVVVTRWTSFTSTDECRLYTGCPEKVSHHQFFKKSH